MSDLFSSAGLDQNAPRPLADRMRPTKLSEVVGQDHLVGPDGILTRLIASKSLGSLIFWGPPGTGKTTVARLMANETDLHFQQISAIFSGVGATTENPSFELNAALLSRARVLLFKALDEEAIAKILSRAEEVAGKPLP